MIYIINFIAFALLAIIWTKSNWFNFWIKVGLFGLTCGNAFYAAQAFGFIVKI